MAFLQHGSVPSLRKEETSEAQEVNRKYNNGEQKLGSISGPLHNNI